MSVVLHSVWVEVSFDPNHCNKRTCPGPARLGVKSVQTINTMPEPASLQAVIPITIPLANTPAPRSAGNRR
jgi:hypothetical protein